MQHIETYDKQLEFKDYLDHSPRIIFSAKYGEGKTQFLKEITVNNEFENYKFFTIYPVNYVVAENADIFEYVKRDILFNIMNKNSTFDKEFKTYMLWFFVGAVVVCGLPWLFTRCWLMDFSDTGQIGDTIGGIMGPFIAIAAAGLTFIAFWVQYKANIQQRHDIAIFTVYLSI